MPRYSDAEVVRVDISEAPLLVGRAYKIHPVIDGVPCSPTYVPCSTVTEKHPDFIMLAHWMATKKGFI